MRFLAGVWLGMFVAYLAVWLEGKPAEPWSIIVCAVFAALLLAGDHWIDADSP